MDTQKEVGLGVMMDEFAEFRLLLERPVETKNREFQRHGELKHLINASQLSVELLDKLFRFADMIRRLAKDDRGNRQLRDLLSHKRAMLYFTQPSTRTFLSFMAACQILGLTCNEVRDPKTSSEVKRESGMDSIRMFSSYFDIIIMRSQVQNFAESCAYLMNQLEVYEKRSVPIINAGSGMDEHPTQALLDMYTLVRTFDFDTNSPRLRSRLSELQQKYPDLIAGPNQKTYLFCGDIGRGRTVRSLAAVLSQYDGIRMFFVTPEHPSLELDPLLRQRLEAKGVSVFVYHSLDALHDGKPLLSQVDAVYMTRIQREHNQKAEGQDIEQLDLKPFRLTLDRVRRMKDFAPILHPFPRDSVVGEIPTEIDFDPRVMYFRQARNGMWARAALLVHLFGVGGELASLYDDFSAKQEWNG